MNRNADWISTEYNNQYDPDSFYSVGSEEIQPVKPELGDESPEDGSDDILLEPILSIDALDYQNDDMDIYFRTNASGTWDTIGMNLTVNDGTFYCDNTLDMDSYSENYWWSVNATDPLGSGNWNNKTFRR